MRNDKKRETGKRKLEGVAHPQLLCAMLPRSLDNTRGQRRLHSDHNTFIQVAPVVYVTREKKKNHKPPRRQRTDDYHASGLAANTSAVASSITKGIESRQSDIKNENLVCVGDG